MKGWESGQGYGYCGKLPSYRPSPLEFTRREYGKVRAHMTGNGETGANVLRTYVAPVPCSNNKEGIE